MVLWKRPKIFDTDAVGVACIALAGLLGHALLLRPLWISAKSLPQWQAQCELVGRQFLEERRLERERRETLTSLRQGLQSEDRRLHDRQALDVCLQQVAALCDSHGIQINEVRPGEDLELPGCVATSVEYKAQAPWESLCQFLAALEDQTQFVDVFSLAVHSEQPGDAGPYQIEWSLRAFFSKPQADNLVADLR